MSQVRVLHRPLNSGLTAAGRNELDVKKQLAGLGTLVAMDADGRHVRTVMLSTIGELSKVLEALQLAATLRKVTSIYANRTAMGNLDAATIGSIASLVSLSLKSTDIDDHGLAHLANLCRLELLHVNDTAVTDAGLAHLATLTRLKILDVSGMPTGSKLDVPVSLPELG